MGDNDMTVTSGVTSTTTPGVTCGTPRGVTRPRLFWAYAGAGIGASASVAANIAHTFVSPPDVVPDWAPSPGAVVASAFWPAALFVAIEIMLRSDWAPGVMSWLVRYVGLVTVAGVAAVVSYRHMSALLVYYGEDGVTSTIGPLAVDGIWLMSTAALFSAERKRRGLPPPPARRPRLRWPRLVRRLAARLVIWWRSNADPVPVAPSPEVPKPTLTPKPPPVRVPDETRDVDPARTGGAAKVGRPKPRSVEARVMALFGENRHTVKEIASKVGKSERQVQRIKQKYSSPVTDGDLSRRNVAATNDNGATRQPVNKRSSSVDAPPGGEATMTSDIRRDNHDIRRDNAERNETAPEPVTGWPVWVPVEGARNGRT